MLFRSLWSDDWERWGKEFTKGNLLRVRLQPPSNGFPTFLLESNSGIGRMRYQKKYREKEDDPRVYVMKFGKKEEEKFMTEDEVFSSFSNLGMQNGK